jgi:hypothetical protein
MIFSINKILSVVTGYLILALVAVEFVPAKECYNLCDTSCISAKSELKTYSDIVLFRNKFIAVGTDGRIDCISKSGERVSVKTSGSINFNCAFSNNEVIIAAGNNGTILYSSDGENFYRAESGTGKNINGITSKDGVILAGADGGTILSSKDGKLWNIITTEIKGNIISLSFNNSFFIGVTDAGEIIKSSDGIKWEIQDYNKEYGGYNMHANFNKILAALNGIAIIGTHNDGSPCILFSSLGNVWAERIPIYHDDQGNVTVLTKEPNGITYNPDKDEFVLACDDGGIFVMPACAKCNEYEKISDYDLKAIIYTNNFLLIAGEQFCFYQKEF